MRRARPSQSPSEVLEWTDAGMVALAPAKPSAATPGPRNGVLRVLAIRAGKVRELGRFGPRGRVVWFLQRCEQDKAVARFELQRWEEARGAWVRVYKFSRLRPPPLTGLPLFP